MEITREQYEADIREAKAKAWGEGYDAGDLDNEPDVRARIECGRVLPVSNPYRHES